MQTKKSSAEINGVTVYNYYAGGEWRTANSGKAFDVYRPYDRTLYARSAACGREEATSKRRAGG